MSFENLLRTMVLAIVDNDIIEIVEEKDAMGYRYRITVSDGDVGKLIGKSGRIANSIKAIAKAAGAKQGVKVSVWIVNTPL